MWEFIKYCLHCLLMSISAAFGNNPEGMEFNHAIVGIVTMFVLLGLSLGILWLISILVNRFRWKKNYGTNRDSPMYGVDENQNVIKQ